MLPLTCGGTHWCSGLGTNSQLQHMNWVGQNGQKWAKQSTCAVWEGELSVHLASFVVSLN